MLLPLESVGLAPALGLASALGVASSGEVASAEGDDVASLADDDVASDVGASVALLASGGGGPLGGGPETPTTPTLGTAFHFASTDAGNLFMFATNSATRQLSSSESRLSN